MTKVLISSGVSHPFVDVTGKRAVAR